MEIDPASIIEVTPSYVKTKGEFGYFETWYCRECGGQNDHSDTCEIGMDEAEAEELAEGVAQA